ncbi:Fe(3+) ABC transporter substrate-binding protein [Falsiroseomonas oryzae]|uniref:Fe(3+) ABC transporter substrate-binding protein n=1 Tax=Falsiroseomonas oryzae TaxID=2766473 RepID=UPI0022EAEC73|nr:Fe(3+) ABC transporter substrate-binding protein [Roseomonas sp. MO-31]
MHPPIRRPDTLRPDTLRPATLRRRSLLAAAGAALFAPGLAGAQDRTLAIYSSRHYDTDRELYDGFTRQSGVRVRLIEANVDQLLERIRAEGANSPADVLVTVDAGRLARAQEAGVLLPIRSAVLDQRIPAHLRDPDGAWYGFSTRARVVMYDRAQGLPAGLARYEDLARPEFRGMVSTRSSSNIYSIGWTASVLAANGPEATEAWARGIAANLSRPPQGGDTDQIRAVAAGQGRLAISNTYYLGLLHRSARAEDRAVAERMAVLFPNQGDRGTHVNISGAGVVRTAPNRDAAQAFLEYLSSAPAQSIFADGNMEYPVVADAQPHAFLRSLGDFRQDPLNAARMAALSPEALRIMQRAGWR